MRVRTTCRWALAAGFSLLLVSSALLAWDQCVTYTNSHAGWVQGYGAVCLGTGGGCTECSGGGTVCVDEAGGEVCIDYQN